MENVPKTVAEGLKWFSGRSWLPEKVLDWYENRTTRLLLLTGEMGSGKSLAAAWLAGLGGEIPAGKPGEQLTALRSQAIGAHFCQAAGGSVAPKALAMFFNRQLSARVSKFDEAFTRTLKELMRIDATLNLRENMPGAEANVVKIDNLSLGEYGDQKSFLLLLHDPLVQMYLDGHKQKMLLVVDGLDEAALYTERYTILNLMKQLANLPEEVRFLATIRSNSAYIGDFPDAERIDLEQDSPDAPAEVSEFVTRRLAGLPPGLQAALIPKVVEAADGKFLHAALVCQDVVRRHADGESLEGVKFPKGLSELYHQELRLRVAKSETDWERNGGVLGLVGAGQGSGLNRTSLEEVVGDDVLPPLKACRPYLDGALTEGPFRLFHKSLSDYLFDEKSNADFHLDAWRQHKKLVEAYWEETDGEPVSSNWDEYLIEHMPVHLRYAIQSPLKKESQRQAERLVALLAQPGYHKRYLKVVQDFSRLEQQARAALQAAVGQSGERAALLVVQAALSRYHIQHSQAQPGEIFQLAEDGNLPAAMRMLAASELEPKWARAAAMTAAWLAASAGAHSAAQAVMHEAYSITVNAWPLPLLAQRTEAVWSGLEPGWEPLPQPPPDRDTAREIVRQLGGGTVDAERISEYLNTATGLFSEHRLANLEGLSVDAASGYVAFVDGPALAAYAEVDELEGRRLFESYVRLHGANQYRHYRDLSLWLLIEPVLRHKSSKFACWGMRLVLEQALRPVDLSHDREDIDLAALARLAKLENQEQARQEFDERRRWAIQAASELSDERGHSDQFGRHKQRLCALAEAASALGALPALQVRQDDCEQAGDDGVDELLRRAICMAGGFAGFLYKAWLRLADAVRICQREAVFSLEEIFKEARQYAVNIHDPVFAALAAAEVSACRELFEAALTAGELEGRVRRFAEDPLAPEFAPRLNLGDGYQGRKVKGAKQPIPQGIRRPARLVELAAELGLPEDALEALNQPEVADRNAPLQVVEWLRLPADNFAPQMAERLSALVLSHPDLDRASRQGLIQLLAPVAARQGEALDIVLGRLLLATEISDEKTMTAIRKELKKFEEKVYEYK